jgi:effector-binding domain-containing protein
MAAGEASRASHLNFEPLAQDGIIPRTVSGHTTELVVQERPTAVIAETTTWEAFRGLWADLLDEVWRTVRQSKLVIPGRNVMLYRDDVPNVEVGVEIGEPFSRIGRVFCSSLPAGRVVMTTHRGRYEELGLAHSVVIQACDEGGLERLGPRWEIYGHWNEASADQEVEVYYLVR